jgi:hydrogenase nickel incorporation protein HypA/HybF
MHELAVCQAIGDSVRRHSGGKRVIYVGVKIGYFRQVVPKTLSFYWRAYTENSDLAGSQLDIEHVPAVVRCRTCGVDTTLSLPIPRCDACMSDDVAMIAGEEMSVVSIGIAEPAAESRSDSESPDRPPMERSNGVAGPTPGHRGT